MPMMSTYRTALKVTGVSLFALTAGLLAATAGLAQTPLQTQTPDTGSAALASAPGFDQNAPAPQLPALGEGMLMSVNKDMVTSYDLKQRMLLLIVTSGVQVTQENYAALQQQAESSLVDEHLQQQEMTHWKVTVSDKEIDEEIDRMAHQSGLTGPQLLVELKKVGVESQTLRDQISAQTGWSQLVGGRYHSNASVGKAQVEAMMDRVISDGQKRQFNISEIFLDATQAGGLDTAQKGAQQLYTQIQAKVAPFQAVARQFSNAPSAAQGGDEGWIAAGSLDPQIEAVLETMAPGDMSAPITTKDGVHIVLLRNKSDGNADMVFHVKQAAVSLPADATPAQVSSAESQLTAYRSRAKTCDGVDETKASGIQVTDLGEAQLSLLQTSYADALRPLKPTQSTVPMRNAQNVNVLFVCDRQLAGDNAVTRDQIQESLVNERLAMLGKRYLRELRSSATIENH